MEPGAPNPRTLPRIELVRGETRVTRQDSIYTGRQRVREPRLRQQMDVKFDQLGLKYNRASHAVRNFLRFYGFIHVTYDGTPESFKLLV